MSCKHCLSWERCQDWEVAFQITVYLTEKRAELPH
jgi:hypothetical protein